MRGVYTWRISKNAAFVQKVAILGGSDNTDVELDTSLTPARPFDKTDTFTTISLEYGF